MNLITADKYKDYKPFKYITKKYNISRPALYKRIAKIPGFEKQFMVRDRNRWLVSPKGIKLITFHKVNSTSDFKSKKIGHYKQKQPTKSDLMQWSGYLAKTTKGLMLSNQTLIQETKQLAATNKTNADTINKLHSELTRNHNLYENEKKKLTKAMKNNQHGLLWKLFH